MANILQRMGAIVWSSIRSPLTPMYMDRMGKLHPASLFMRSKDGEEAAEEVSEAKRDIKAKPDQAGKS